MTCPDRPHDLDLLLAGEPVPETVRQHAASCEACHEEVHLDARITEALRSRRAVTAPAGLVAAALAEAKREAPPARPSRRAPAASRPAVRSARPRRLRIAGVALLAVLLVAALLLVRDTPETGTLTAEAPAETVAPETSAPDPLDEEAPAAPDLAPDEEAAVAPTVAPEEAPRTLRDALPAPRRATPPRPRAPRRAPAPAPAPAPEEAPEQENLAQNAPDADAPSPEEVAQAEADLKLAFALVGQAHSRARRAVATSADALSPTLDHALPFTP